MYIKSVAINNYKSFYAFPPLQLGPGINVIVGPNNAGKTALLEVLSGQFVNHPHRSRKTAPEADSQTELASNAKIRIHLDAGEAKWLLINSTGTFTVPTNDPNRKPARAQEIVAALEQADTFSCVWNAGMSASDEYLLSLNDDKFISSAHSVGFVVDRRGADSTIRFAENISGSRYGSILMDAIRKRIYKFQAARSHIGVSAFGLTTALAADASNLPEVLHNLRSSNDKKFAQFNQHVREIFPDIAKIGVPAGPGVNQVQIQVWPATEADTDREDLAIPLMDSGTGVSQVLAMLYVVLFANHPRTIIIDEPQSFLNPGAIRKLFEIFKAFPQHQFIVTTHSPDVINAASPATVTLLQKQDAETVAEQSDVTETQHMQNVLSAVGARLSDVFGADRVLWVEGATEEKCFPIIIKDRLELPLLGTRIAAMLHTDDLKQKDSDRVLGIYRSLTTGGSLIPPALAFIFDRELLSVDKQNDLKRRAERSGSTVAFIGRRMYENYLLNPRAIAAIISTISGFRDEPVTAEEVEQWLAHVSGDTAFFANKADAEAPDWLVHVDGATVLDKLFCGLSEG